ncbi:hypothetical protein K1719_021030 [Acacia pycnantha]|nr:hypothetical protein K1719_021030 [Acacia pycnantha]
MQVFNERQNMNDIKLTLDTLLPLFSSQFLTVLKLTGIKIPPVDACIKCPELKQLLINSYDGFRTINVSSSSPLKQVEVKYCKGLRAFQILEGKSLQSFEFQGSHCELPPCTVDISDCLSLRVLKLKAAKAITDEWLNRTMRSLSYLEELHICQCNLLEKIEFENYSLKKFTLWASLKQKKVVADVPNLLEFNFLGYISYRISILSKVLKPGPVSEPVEVLG